jgi:hypothetical protein
MHTITPEQRLTQTEMVLGLYMALAALLGHRINLRRTRLAEMPHQRLMVQVVVVQVVTGLARLTLRVVLAAGVWLVHT